MALCHTEVGTQQCHTKSTPLCLGMVKRIPSLNSCLSTVITLRTYTWGANGVSQAIFQSSIAAQLPREEPTRPGWSVLGAPRTNAQTRAKRVGQAREVWPGRAKCRAVPAVIQFERPGLAWRACVRGLVPVAETDVGVANEVGSLEHVSKMKIYARCACAQYFYAQKVAIDPARRRAASTHPRRRAVLGWRWQLCAAPGQSPRPDRQTTSRGNWCHLRGAISCNGTCWGEVRAGCAAGPVGTREQTRGRGDRCRSQHR